MARLADRKSEVVRYREELSHLLFIGFGGFSGDRREKTRPEVLVLMDRCHRFKLLIQPRRRSGLDPGQEERSAHLRYNVQGMPRPGDILIE